MSNVILSANGSGSFEEDSDDGPVRELDPHQETEEGRLHRFGHRAFVIEGVFGTKVGEKALVGRGGAVGTTLEDVRKEARMAFAMHPDIVEIRIYQTRTWTLLERVRR